MKRKCGALASAILLALSLSSCEQMFTTNLFSGMAHPKPTASDITAKSAAELATYVDSEANLKVLADNPELKDAALAKLESVYTDPAASPTEKQTAAATAATISIETVETASNFSSNLLGALTASAASSSSGSMDSQEGVIDLLKSSLGSDIADKLASSEEPPEGFIELIDAFAEAYDAYAALGQSVKDNAGYTAGAGISESEKNGIAINAIISSLINLMEPVDPTKTRAQALWAALRNPDGAGSVLKISDLDAVKSLSVYSLVEASSLGSLMEG
jgi:hypothetical protein